MNKINGVKHIIAVSSGKGGVGKSTTAMNLAIALSVKGKKVGIMDADVYGPSMPRMLNAKDAKPQSDGDRIDPIISGGLKCMSMGFMMEEDEPIVWRGPMVQSALMQMLEQVNWAPLDVLIVDMPPGTGDVQLSMAQKIGLDGAIVVSTPQDIALIDAVKGLKMFEKVDVPIVGFVENMSVFICPECGHESHIFSHGGATKKAKELDVPLLAEIPLDMDIRLSTDEGNSIVTTQPQSHQAQAYHKLADGVLDFIESISNEGKVKIVIK